MLLMWRERKAWGPPAARVLDFALTGHVSACERFVDVLGLGACFAAFVGKVSLASGPCA